MGPGVGKATLKDPDLADPGAFLVSPEQADIVKEKKLALLCKNAHGDSCKTS
jgi:hypothetical protein